MNMTFEEIYEEVKDFDDQEQSVDVPNKCGVEVAEYETIETPTLWMETDIRNSMLKSLALMAATAGCACLNLMHPVLYIPITIGCLMTISFKFGEYRGRNN